MYDNALIPIYFGDSPGDYRPTIVQQLGGKFIAVGDDDRVTKVRISISKTRRNTRCLQHFARYGLTTDTDSRAKARPAALHIQQEIFAKTAGERLQSLHIPVNTDGLAGRILCRARTQEQRLQRDIFGGDHTLQRGHALIFA